MTIMTLLKPDNTVEQQSKPCLEQDYVQLPKSYFSHIDPEAMDNARLVSVNRALMKQLNCDLNDDELLDLLSGHLQRVDANPLAQKYVGHQFGVYNPDLGDGRGMLLGQWRDNSGQAWDFHLKGAGRTPYSRRGDGRAVLRSTIREYLASEALFGLGVPTTRGLAIATSDEAVRREVMEPRATLIRVSHTHIRFGHFQFAASKGAAHMETLLNFVVQKHYPEHEQDSLEQKAWTVLYQACIKTAKLLAKWQTVGFNHGVMNTDNMSIIGETFDFGPFAFFDDFKIDFICNHSDYEGRYAYNQQAQIALWNCKVLASCFEGLLTEEQAQQAMDDFVQTYNLAYLEDMNQKLGLASVQTGDKELIGDLLVLMDQFQVDYSLFFRRLAKWQTDVDAELFELIHPDQLPTGFQQWFEKFQIRVQQESIEMPAWRERILKANPSIVLRNYIAQQIIEKAEKGDYTMLNEWLVALQTPFDDHPSLADFQQPPRPYQKGMQLSCSS